MKIVVLQHLSVEHPGVFREFWTEGGHTFDTVELDAGDQTPDLSAYDLMVVMGGPMDVWQVDIYPWLAVEKGAIRHWVRDLQRPYLGICLGHQLLADALGGKVELMSSPEVGLSNVMINAEGTRDPILAGFESTIETFQWHGAEVSELPPGAVALAGNLACPIQAFRYGRWAYGFQYHCEILPSTVAEWQQIPEYAASLERSLGSVRAAGLDAEVAQKLPAFREAAKRLNRNLFSTITKPAPPPDATLSSAVFHPF